MSLLGSLGSGSSLWTSAANYNNKPASSGGSGINWGNVATSIMGSGGNNSSSSGGWLSTIGNMFGGGSSGSSGQQGGGSNMWGAILSGLGGAADSYMSKGNTREAAEEAGKQQRKTAGYAADLNDYYSQKDKTRKRIALDTYGQFSQMKRWAPNAVGAPPIELPNKPTAG